MIQGKEHRKQLPLSTLTFRSLTSFFLKGTRTRSSPHASVPNPSPTSWLNLCAVHCVSVRFSSFHCVSLIGWQCNAAAVRQVPWFAIDRVRPGVWLRRPPLLRNRPALRVDQLSGRFCACRAGSLPYAGRQISLRAQEWTGYRFGDPCVRLWHQTIGMSKSQIRKERADAMLSNRTFVPVFRALII